MKRRRSPGPTRAELARQLADATRENAALLDVLAESTREVTDLRGQLAGVVR